MLGLVAAMTALLLQAPNIDPQDAQTGARVGDVYEIRIRQETAENSSDGLSSGSSHSRSTLMERVIAVRDTGVELEFDLPAEATPEDRARIWQYPARVLQPPRGALQLLNGPELEGRVDAWLRAAGLPREACGRWYFTWNAFQIECDPQSVIQGLARLDLRVEDLRDGAPYQDPSSRGPAPLRRQPPDRDGAIFVVELEVDPEAARRERAEADIVVAEITRGERISLETALQARSTERISGTMTITFETDDAGRVRRRTKVTRLEIVEASGTRETHTSTETVERQLVARALRPEP